MATTPTKIKIDSNLKKEAVDLFNELGLDITMAINIFLHQCVLRGGIPFAIEIPRYNEKVLAAMDEAKQFSSDPNIESYDDIEKLQEALNN